MKTGKTIRRRMLSGLLAAMICAALLLPLMAPAAAAETPSVYVRTYSSARNRYMALELKDAYGEAYIRTSDLATLADLEVRDGAEPVFTRPDSVFTCTAKGSRSIDGETWLPLRETADAVRLAFWYDEDIRTLYAQHSSLYEEDLLDMAISLTNEGTGYNAYYLGNITDNVPLVELSSIFNRLLNDGIIMGAIKSVTGEYGRNMYESLIKEMMVDETDTLKELYDGMSKAQKAASTTIKVLRKAEKFKNESLEKLQRQGEKVSDWFDPFDPIFNIHENQKLKLLAFWDKFPLISPSDLVELYYNCHLAAMSDTSMLQGFHYALEHSEYLESLTLSAAVRSITAYVGKSESTGDDLTFDMLLEGMTDLEHLSLEAVLKELKLDYNDFAVKPLAGLINDKLIPVVDRTKAVESSMFLAEMQTSISYKLADYTWRARTRKGQEARDSLVAAKYCALFYLRAAEIGYAMYLPDGKSSPLFPGLDLAPYVTPLLEKTRAMMKAISAFDDSALSSGWAPNERLDLTRPGFRDSAYPILSRGPFESAAGLSAAACAFMFARAETGRDDPVYEIARADYDGDGVSDWVVRCPDSPDALCFIDGSEPSRFPTVLRTRDGGPLTVYRARKLPAVTVGYTNEKGARCLSVFDGALQEPYMKENTDPSMKGHWSLFRDGRWYGTYQEDGSVPLHFGEEELAWNLTGKKTRTLTSEYWFHYGEVLEPLRGFGGVSNIVEDTINADSLTDAMIFFLQPKGTLAYTDGGYGSYAFPDGQAAVLLASQGSESTIMTAEVLTEAEALAMLTPEQAGQAGSGSASASSEADPLGNYEDGDHRVLIYRDRIERMENDEAFSWCVGCDAFFDRGETYSAQEVAALRPGSTLHGIEIWQVDGDVEEDVAIALNNGEILLEETENGRWYVYSTTEASVVYDVAHLEYLCVNDCVYYVDDYDTDRGDYLRQVKGPEAMFEDDGDWVETAFPAVVRLENGYAVSITREYWYDFAYDYFAEVYRDQEYPDDGYEPEEGDPLADGDHAALLDRTEITDREYGGWMCFMEVISYDRDITFTREEAFGLGVGDRIRGFTVETVEIDEEDGMIWLNGGEVLLESWDGGETWELVFAQDELLFADTYTVGYDMPPDAEFIRAYWDADRGEEITEVCSSPYELLEPWEIKAEVTVTVEDHAAVRVSRYWD